MRDSVLYILSTVLALLPIVNPLSTVGLGHVVSNNALVAIGIGEAVTSMSGA